GRGHTDHDLVVSVPDAGVVFWGDLIEQGADPAMEDSFPLEWADTVQRILEKVPDHTIAVPGHGDVVDQAYVIAQQEQLAQLAATLEDALAEGIREVERLVAKCRGLGLQETTLRDAAVRLLETAAQPR